jgi:hypothetical protein
MQLMNMQNMENINLCLINELKIFVDYLNCLFRFNVIFID